MTATKRPEEQWPVQRCIGCACLFRASRTDRVWCDEECKKRNWANSQPAKTTRPNLRKEIVMTRAAIAFREMVLRTKPDRAVGYALSSISLGIRFPLGGRTMRSTGRFDSRPYFSIEPYESPIVPIEGVYAMRWISRSGVDLEQSPRQYNVSFPVDMRTNRLVKKLLRIHERETNAAPREFLVPPPKRRLMLR